MKYKLIILYIIFIFNTTRAATPIPDGGIDGPISNLSNKKLYYNYEDCIKSLNHTGLIFYRTEFNDKKNGETINSLKIKRASTKLIKSSLSQFDIKFYIKKNNKIIYIESAEKNREMVAIDVDVIPSVNCNIDDDDVLYVEQIILKLTKSAARNKNKTQYDSQSASPYLTIMKAFDGDLDDVLSK